VHADTTCRCTKIATVLEEDFIGPDVEEVLHWLDEKEDGAIPIVVFEPPSTVRVLHWEPDKHVDFVAFSHVWADGLGNRRGNSLPICQLQTLQKMANEVMAVGGFRSDQPTPFWIDALCVPREPRSCRDIAIRRLRATYASAARVLVSRLGDEEGFSYRKRSRAECEALHLELAAPTMDTPGWHADIEIVSSNSETGRWG
jgi:hypothetical protein